MEDLKKKSSNEASDKDIVFSQSVKAGKRIYYFDVKKNRKNEMFLAITESKKIVTGEGENPQVSFEKHKIFLYQEDFDKFLQSLQESIDFIKGKTNIATAEKKDTDEADNEKDAADGTPLFDHVINVDLDF